MYVAQTTPNDNPTLDWRAISNICIGILLSLGNLHINELQLGTPLVYFGIDSNEIIIVKVRSRPNKWLSRLQA
jgi:hypothetical protein